MWIGKNEISASDKQNINMRTCRYFCAWPYATMSNKISMRHTCTIMQNESEHAGGSLRHVVSGHLLPSGTALNFLACARPAMYVCIFVRAVSRLVVGMLKGCVQHLVVDSSRRWEDRKEELMGSGLGAGHYSNQMRIAAHSWGIKTLLKKKKEVFI